MNVKRKSAFWPAVGGVLNIGFFAAMFFLLFSEEPVSQESIFLIKATMGFFLVVAFLAGAYVEHRKGD